MEWRYSDEVLRRRSGKSASRVVIAVALALALIQASAFAMANACCCRRMTMAAGDSDCCPAGSHPPGQCPLHRDAAEQQHQHQHQMAMGDAAAPAPTAPAPFMLRCGASRASTLFVTAGMTPAAPSTFVVALISSLAPAPLAPQPLDLARVPHAPPPRA